VSYFLLADGKANFAGSTTPLIKKADREAFVDAAALLHRASQIAGDADASIEAARAEAVQRGYAEGAAAAEAELDETIRGFGDAIARIEEHHAAQLAEAAYAAAAAIIGEFDDEQLVSRLVAKVLASQKDHDGLSIHIAPALQPKLAGKFGETGELPVLADPELGPAECHVMTANGRIIASLPVQLAVLRERWGLNAAEESE
jgi:flagellar biosynthesis/type III secretory pathway protein FliH